MRTRRVLGRLIHAVPTLRALRSVIIQPGVSVPRTELQPVREALFQNHLQGVVNAAASWHIAPQNILVLGITPQRLRHVTIEGAVRQRDSSWTDASYRHGAIARRR